MNKNIFCLLVAVTFLVSNQNIYAQTGYGAGCYTLLTGTATPVTGDGPIDIIAGDWNADGNQDVITANYASNDLSIILGNGNGTFSTAVSFTMPAQPRQLAKGDFDSDGSLDLAVACNNHNVYFLQGTGTGSFVNAAGFFATGSSMSDLLAADLNNDGFLDLARTDDSQNNVRVMLGDGAGSFSLMPTFTVGTNPYGLKAADFNEDGHMDLAVVVYFDRVVRTYTGTSTGSFSLATTYTVAGSLYGPLSIAVADFNMDGHMDVLTGQYNSSGNLAYGNGTGGFSYSDLVNMAVDNYGIDVADFDLDGHMDAVYVGYGSNRMQIAVYTGLHLAGHTNNALGNNTYPNSVVTGDFNNDGRPDAVSGNFGSDNISVWLNNVPSFSVNPGYRRCPGEQTTFSITSAGSYTWGSGPNTASLTVSPAAYAYYTFSVVSAAGCTMSSFKEIDVIPAATVTAVNHTICSGQQVTITPGGAISYTISGGQFVVSPTLNTTYSVTGTGTSGCVSAVKTVSVRVNAQPTVAVNSGSICTGQTFTIVPAGATAYTITGGSAVVSPTSTTSYSVTGTTTAGCINATPAVSTVTVDPTPPPVISVSSGSICQGSPITFTPSGASTYTFIDGVLSYPSTGPITFTPPGTKSYTVTGTNSVNCIASATAIATATVYLLPVNIGSTNVTCAGTPVVINIVSNAATTTITGGSFTVNPPTTSFYTVTGTSTAGCVSPPAVSTVIVLPLPTITVNSGSICTGNTFTMTPSGAFTYSYSNGSATAAPTTNTFYTVTGTGTNGCISGSAAVANVTVHALPVISVNSGSICAGNVFTITPSGAATYSYNGGSNLVSPVTNTTYVITGTSNVGCPSSNSAVSAVTVVSRPVVSVNSGSICVGQSFTISPSGAVTYSIAGTASVVSPGTNTTYAVVGYNSQGCASSNTALATVSVFPNPNIVLVASAGTICAGDLVSVAASGSDTYTWSTNSNSSVISDAPLTSTVYFVNGKNNTGCAAVQQSVAILVNPTPTVSITGSTLVCAGDPATLTALGAPNFIWSTSHTTHTVVLSPVVTSTYAVIGTNLLNCAALATVQVNVNPLPVITASGPPSMCEGTSATLTAAGAVSYSWSPQGGSGNPVVVSPTISTTFTVEGTDGNGCKAPALLFLTVDDSPTVTAIPSSTAVCMGSTVSLMGAGASTYTWTGGIADNTSFTLTTTKTFTVTGDLGGCTDTAAITISALALPAVSVSASPSLICEGETATLTASGAQQYNWPGSGSGSTIVITPALLNSYSVTGTDANGCSLTATIAVAVDLCTGLSQNSRMSLMVYPNPGSGRFFINVSEQSHVMIWNEMGQCVYHNRAVSGEAEITTLAKGIYFVTATARAERITVKLVVTE